MKFDVVSDIHWDIWFRRTMLDGNGASQIKDLLKNRNVDSEGIIVAGDTSNYISQTEDIVEQMAEEYKHVILISGNHDHYMTNQTVAVGEQQLADIADRFENVTHLNGGSLKIGETTFYGACGWYDWKCYEFDGISESQAYRAWTQGSNDFNYIKFFDQSAAKLADEHFEKLNKMLTRIATDPIVKNAVIITHTVPLKELLYWHPTDQFWNLLSPSYCNSRMTEAFLNPGYKKVSHWIYGHTHKNHDAMIGNTRFINNARGYPGECPGWSFKQIEV